MKKIYLTESQFKNIIMEEILNEGFSRYIYHFCTISALQNIVKSDSFILSPANGNETDIKLNFGYPYYMSFTRQHNSNVGYSAWMNRDADYAKTDMMLLNCRITVDGRKLGNAFRGEPVNYHFRTNKKSRQQQSIGFDEAKLVEIRQSEDRLLSNEPIIRDVSKYIERIDILLTRKPNGKFGQAPLNAVQLILKNQKFSGKIFVFDNKRDYDMPKAEGFINDEILQQVSSDVRNSILDKNAISRNYINKNSSLSRGRQPIKTITNGNASQIASTLSSLKILEGKNFDDILQWVDYVFSEREKTIGASTVSKEKSKVIKQCKLILKHDERFVLNDFVERVCTRLSMSFAGDLKILYVMLQSLIQQCSKMYGGKPIRSIIRQKLSEV